MVRVIQGVGKISMEGAADAHGLPAFARRVLPLAPMTALDTLHSRLLPFFEENGAGVERVLTGNGRKDCSRPLQHFYELFPVLNQIEQRRTEIRSPETDGFCERFHRTVAEEFFAVTFHKTISESFDQLRAGPDRDLEFHSRERV